jgi:asparagine synthase (glutamine-hydrolysing)
VSAVVGVYYTSGKTVDQSTVRQMLDSLAHRGSDGTGIWGEGPIALGHRMRWTTPESLAEKQPVLNQRGDLAITADARIDNREELMAGLKLCGEPSSVSDSQLILAAYEKWGEACPRNLLGDFAFAIWDGRRRALFCARDYFGVKPFYYCLSNGLFSFASEIKALLLLPNLSSHLNELKIAYHLQPELLEQDKELTFYQEIFRLPPANTMTIDIDAAERHRYWSLDPDRELRLKSDDEYSDRFRETFKEAVRCRLRSAFDVGSTLSGGLDSSSIACTARDLLADGCDHRLHTFSAIFPDLPERERRKIDERKFVDAVVAMGGLTPHYIRADCLSPLEDMQRVFWHEDEVVMGPNLYLHWHIYRAAERYGVRVLLDGIDGDSTVSHGVGYLAELASQGRWISLVKEGMELSRITNRRLSPWKIIWEYGCRPVIPQKYKWIWRRMRGRAQFRELSNSIVNPAFAKRVDLTERRRALLEKQASSAVTARQEHWQGLNSGLLPYVLEMADKAACAFSIDPRYPFCDRRLVEFCLAIPASQKLRNGWTRMIMRRAMAGILPNEVRWRAGKANLSPNFQLRLLHAHKELLERVIMKDPSVIAEYVDVPSLQKVYSRYLSQQGADDALVVYGAVTLAGWLSNFSEFPLLDSYDRSSLADSFTS